MRVAIASDHAGFEQKQLLAPILQRILRKTFSTLAPIPTTVSITPTLPTKLPTR